jgi:hypothetical protein
MDAKARENWAKCAFFFTASLAFFDAPEILSSTMDLQTLLERVEPSRLKQLGSLLALGESLTKTELVDWVSQELPFCQVEEDGACVGIDGAFYIAVDWVSDISTLELLRDCEWTRHQPDGKLITFRVTDEITDISVGDGRLLLALLAVATYNDGEMPIPRALLSARYQRFITVEETTAVHAGGRPSQIPGEAPPSQRPSIPPGMSPTFDSMRPQRQSVIPSAGASVEPSTQLDPALIEWLLTLPRHSVISAAFALAERGADSHVIAVGPTGGRAVISADAVEAAERLFEDHRDSMPPPSQADAMVSYRKRLITALSFFGIGASDASSLVALTTDLQTFPDFWSSANPPPKALARRELTDCPEELVPAAARLLYDVFYSEQFDSVDTLVSAWLPH